MASLRETNLRATILEQAAKLFKLFGYNKLVMEDVARAVRKSRSTIYIYFKDKEAIFRAIVEQEIHNYLEELHADLPNHKTAADQLRAYFQIKFDFRHAKATEYLTMNQEGHPELLDMMRQYTDPPEIAHLTAIIKSGVDSGEFEPLTPDQINLMAYLMISGLHGIANDVLSKVETANIIPVRLLLAKMFIEGLERKK